MSRIDTGLLSQRLAALFLQYRVLTSAAVRQHRQLELRLELTGMKHPIYVLHAPKPHHVRQALPMSGEDRHNLAAHLTEHL